MRAAKTARLISEINANLSMTTTHDKILPMALISLAILAFSVFSGGVNAAEKTPLENRADTTNHQSMTTSNNKILAIYFSRSGNTELMAMEIAKYYKASLIHLEATDYHPGFRGLINAVKDSRSEHAEINPGKLDLSPYQTIFIGAPIWWHSPAPPVWQFVKNNNFADKDVVLFTTFNSSFKQKYIDDFQIQVERKGGTFIKHIHIKRGRITQQISDEILSKKAGEKLDKLQLQ